ncbi:MAG: 3-methyl-2-oxobutanoate hydroxymethyltransferase [Candidatus Eisenbacteria bacterium]|nr:3-methyl-2-oxobutanoate hydroxymethyltransferase [Candidatus Eisenbacteria bacterium]
MAEPLVMLTAYDFPTARALDAAGVDILLVGDSVGMVVLGYDTTLPVTMEEMLHHVGAVARAKTRALVVADMPWMSYHTGVDDAVRNAGRFIKEAGADAVKLEGGIERVPVVLAVVAAEIPVMGHLGLTPQSVLRFGGYRVQGRGEAAVEALVESARALEQAGCFSLVLEGIPAPAAAAITAAVSIPTIGIGAGPDTDGQVLVIHDLIGFGGEHVPRFVRRYADMTGTVIDAAQRFVLDVRAGRYPEPSETYPE